MDYAVSVVIPAYNCEKYLADCLRSLVNQTLQAIEIIVVDDGSADATPQICARFAKEDERVKVVTQPNGGSAAARRNGMLHAHGEYIGFVDSDDWAEPDMFETLYRAAKEHDCDMVFCNCLRNYPDREIRCDKYIENGYYDRKRIVSDILSRSLAGLDAKGRNHVIRWANYLRLYRRSMVERYQIYNDPRFRRCQDLQLTFEATLHAQSYCYLGDAYLYHNRVVDASQSRGYTRDLWYKLRMLIEKLYEDVDAFTEADLHAQMDLCAFFFAVYAIQNEAKFCADISEQRHRELLQELCDDPLCARFLKSIPTEKLSPSNRRYYAALQSRDIDAMMRANRFDSRQNRKRMLKSKILSVGAIKKFYLKIRRK